MPKPGVLHSISPIYAAGLFLRTQAARQAPRPVCSWCGYFIVPGDARFDGEPGTLDHLEGRPARPRPQDLTPAIEAWRFDLGTGPHAPEILVPACHGCNSIRPRGRAAFQLFLDTERDEGGRIKVADAWAWVRHAVASPLPAREQARAAAWGWWPDYLKARSAAGAIRSTRSRVRRAGEGAILALREDAAPTRAQLQAARSLGWMHATRLALTKAGAEHDAILPDVAF